MKKFLVSMMAAFLVFAFVGSAAASFETSSTVLSIYHFERTPVIDGVVQPPKIGMEVGLDLGNIYAMSGLTNQALWTAGSFSAADFGLDSLSKLKAGIYSYHAFGSMTDMPYYEFALTEAKIPTFSSQTVFSTGYNNIRALYDGVDVNGKAIVDANNINSYFKKMDALGSGIGTYANINGANAAIGEAALTDTGYVDLYLYHYDYLLANSTYPLDMGSVYGSDTPYYAVIRLGADGSVTLNPTVPAPGTFFLLCSGLLGIVGIRRKN